MCDLGCRLVGLYCAHSGPTCGGTQQRLLNLKLEMRLCVFPFASEPSAAHVAQDPCRTCVTASPTAKAAMMRLSLALIVLLASSTAVRAQVFLSSGSTSTEDIMTVTVDDSNGEDLVLVHVALRLCFRQVRKHSEPASLSQQHVHSMCAGLCSVHAPCKVQAAA